MAASRTRVATWALSDAVLATGAELAAAGGGLPQRVRQIPPATVSNVGSPQQVCTPSFDDDDRFFYCTYADAGGWPPKLVRIDNPAVPVRTMANYPDDSKAVRWDATTGELLVTSYNLHKVQRLNPDTFAVLGDLVANTNPGGVGTTYPAGLALLPNGDLAVSSGQAGGVCTFSRAGALLHKVNYVMGYTIVETSDADLVWIANGAAGSGRIARVRLSTGAVDGYFGAVGRYSIGTAGRFAEARACALGPDGHLYIHDDNRYSGAMIQITRYPNASEIATPEIVVAPGTRPGQVKTSGAVTGGYHPAGIAFSPSGRWVAYSDVVYEDNAALPQRWTFRRVDTARAQWTRAFATAATLTFILVPGSLGNERDATFDDRKTRCYYSTNGVDFTEFTPGSPLSVAIAAGATLTVRVDMSTWGKPTGTPPWIGGDAGEGPSIIYTEDDPHGPDATVTVTTPAAIGVTVAAPPRITVTVRS